jgi:hypothetical protein
MKSLWKQLLSVVGLAVIAIIALVVCIELYHRYGPPAQERGMREAAVLPLLRSHATREQVTHALGLEFDDFSVGSTNRQWLKRAFYDERARQRAEQYPGVLFHTTALTMTWLFFDADGRLQDYYLCEQ